MTERPIRAAAIRELMPDQLCVLPFKDRLVPFWYRIGMTKQIAVRLADDLVEFVDDLVEAGAGRSRAAIVTRALERERRREVAIRDATILATQGQAEDLADLAEHASRVALDLP